MFADPGAIEAEDAFWGQATREAAGMRLPAERLPMDPSTIALINAGSNVLGRALSPSGAPTRSESQSNPIFNSSGWSVDFGPGGASATAETRSPLSPSAMLILGAVALVAILAWARKR